MHSLVVEVVISLSPCELLSSGPVVLPNAPSVTAIDRFRSPLDHSSASLALLEVGGREPEAVTVLLCDDVLTGANGHAGGPTDEVEGRCTPLHMSNFVQIQRGLEPLDANFLRSRGALNMIEQPRGSSGRGREIERRFEGCSTMCLLTIVAAGMHAIASSRSNGSVSQDAVLCGPCALRAHKHGGRGRRTGGSPGLASAPHRR